MGDNDITIPQVTPQEVTNVIEKPNEAIPHVVDHEHRLTQMEEKQAQDIARLEARIASTQGELMQAIDASRQEQASMLEGRLAKLQETLESMQATAVEAPQETLDAIDQAPTDAVQLVPEVEPTPGNTSKKYKGLRERRIEKRGNRNG